MVGMCKFCIATFLYVGLICVSKAQSDSQPPSETQSDPLQKMINDYKESMQGSKSPNSVEALASAILKKAFGMTYTNPTGVSAMELMQKVQTLKGEARYYVLRIFEMMDSHVDGQINSDEVTFAMKNPVSSPSAMADFFFRLKDFDGNGFITPWEIMRQNLDLEMSNTPMSKLWQKSVEEINLYDVDDNKVIDLEEFLLAMAMETSIGIAAPLNDAKKKQRVRNMQGGTGKEKVAPKRAHKPNPNHM